MAKLNELRCEFRENIDEDWIEDFREYIKERKALRENQNNPLTT